MEDKSELIQKIKESIKYLKQHIELPEGLKVVLKSDCKNSKDFFGKTAHYDPENKKIVLYITNRHPKDIIRSLFHECLHSNQDTRGNFQNLTSAEEGYAQKNPHLREMEREAYEKGNMLFRDWEDDYKKRRQHTTMSEKKEQHIEETFTDIFSGRRKSLNESLMKKFGILKESEELEEDEQLDEEEEQLDEEQNLEEKHVEIHKDDPEWTKNKQKEGPIKKLILSPEKKWVAKEEKKK